MTIIPDLPVVTPAKASPGPDPTPTQAAGNILLDMETEWRLRNLEDDLEPPITFIAPVTIQNDDGTLVPLTINGPSVGDVTPPTQTADLLDLFRQPASDFSPGGNPINPAFFVDSFGNVTIGGGGGSQGNSSCSLRIYRGQNGNRPAEFMQIVGRADPTLTNVYTIDMCGNGGSAPARPIWFQASPDGINFTPLFKISPVTGGAQVECEGQFTVNPVAGGAPATTNTVLNSQLLVNGGTIGLGDGTELLGLLRINANATGQTLVQFQVAGSNKWQCGMNNTTPTQWFLYDGANARYHLQCNAGATATTALTYLSSSLRVDGNVGFYATVPVAKPTVTGSVAGNAALSSLLQALATQGLITNSTTA